MRISNITAYEILASGGYPTVEAVVTLEDGSKAKASVPYGASAGSHEASVLTDGGNRYNGQGMLQVVETITQKIAPALQTVNPEDQQAIDAAMLNLDGTPTKTTLGGNAILAVSLAIAKAVANSKKIPLYKHIIQTFNLDTQVTRETLPKPMMVTIEGGKHAHNSTDLQEFCLTGISGTPTQSIQKVLETYHQTKKILAKANLNTNVGNEGAFAPAGIASNEKPLEYLTQAIEQAGYAPTVDIGLSIDAAASEFYQDGKYHLKLENQVFSAEELSAYYQAWLEKYPLLTVEDMHHEDDWQAWSNFRKITSQHDVTLIGDDLTVTNVERLQKAIDHQAISGILIKLNQIGSLSETVATCKLAKQQGLMTVPSHRGGGETNDTAMVDLAVAVGSSYIKVGPTRGERVSKYNRLMEIERELL